MILLPLFLFTACGDDDDSVAMESYIIGKWHSYKAVVSANNQSVDLDVSKTGQYSVFYYEMTFKNDNTVILGYYEVDKNQMSSWKTVIQIVVSVLSAILTTLTTTSCMGRGPF